MLNLTATIQSAGYLGITLAVFAENGLLIGFFLPGDSLLFTAGLLAAQHYFNIWILLILCLAASIIGVSVGYAFGHRFGRRLFHRPDSWLFKKENLERAEDFYRRHGRKTIILARFIPIIRTFAPIVAGIADMPYAAFTFFNVLGGTMWVLSITLLGYWLGGTIPSIDRYVIPILGIIILLSVLPGIMHMMRSPETRQSAMGRLKKVFRR